MPAVLLALVSCGPPPKPRVLAQLQHAHRISPYVHARTEAPRPMRQSAEARHRAEQAWRSGDLTLCRHWARIGMLRAEQGVVAAEQRRAERALAAIQRQSKQLAHRRDQLATAIDTVDEKIMLYEQLAVAEISTKEKELELSDFQQQLDAQRELDRAQLALKLSETVHAPRHAKRLHDLARLALQRGVSELKAGRYQKASRAARLARQKAETAYAKARPPFLQERRAEEREALSRALEQDASKLPLRIKPVQKEVGKSRQLVLSLTGLFSPGSTVPRRKQLQLLGQVAALLKKYGDVPVLINGHTSATVPRDRRYALSLSRARQVTNYLLTLGLPFERFAVSGRGAEDPIGGRLSSRNDRVDVILLFH